jgi:hypothetical protein
VALDRAVVAGVARTAEVARYEIELQLFTALPWTSRVDAARVERFVAFCRAIEQNCSLVRARRSGYQAIPKELLR